MEIDKSQRNVSDSTDKMFVIRGTNEQIQYAQQLIYEKITGVIKRKQNINNNKINKKKLNLDSRFSATNWFL